VTLHLSLPFPEKFIGILHHPELSAIYNIAQRTHIINLKLAGYSNYSTSVDVQANQIIQVPAALVPGRGIIPVPTRVDLSTGYHYQCSGNLCGCHVIPILEIISDPYGSLFYVTLPHCQGKR
jgi:hypothetical protein